MAGIRYVNGRRCSYRYKAIRKQVGYMPGKILACTKILTVEEILNFFATLFNTTYREKLWLESRKSMCRVEPFKTRKKLGKLSGGHEAKSWHFCCSLIHQASVLFLGWGLTGVGIQFPERNSGICLAPGKHRNVRFWFRLLIWMRRHFVWANVPWSRRKKSCHRYARSHYSVFIRSRFFAVKSSKWVCCLEIYGSKIWPKVALLLGGFTPHIQRKFTVNQQCFLKSLEM